jgi:hypothetical protein
MAGALRLVPLALLLSLLTLPAAAGAFTLSLPADTSVKIDSSSRLAFTVKNTAEEEGLSRLTLRFPSGYRVTGGSAPPGWTVEQSPNPAGGTGEISFRTVDEAKCTGAIAPDESLVFEVKVTAALSRSVTSDSLVSAQAEQSCRGVILDPPSALPSWERLGIEATLAAGPSLIGLGGVVTATMSVTNLSTVELKDISALLQSTGTGSVSGLAGPAPGNLTLAPGASGTITWTSRATSPGAVSFSGQAMAKDLSSPPVRSDPLYVGDLDVSLSVAPEQVESGQDVQVQMTVTNRGPVRVGNVVPSSLGFEGTATPSAPAGPSPASQLVLEPGEAATFAWAATLSGKAGEIYAFSGWASAEQGAIVSAKATSNGGALAQEEVTDVPQRADDSFLAGGGSADSGGGGTAAAAGTTGGGTATAAPSATLQFIAVNNDGTSAGGAQFPGNLVRALRILVGWQSLSGTHSQRIEIFSPDGSLYQQFSTQFAGTPVETRLPVTGSWITQNFLFGAWRVDVFLDSDKMPITSGAFLLTP